VQEILRRLGVRSVRFVDEPVAAALGYGLNLTEDRTILVVDIGGGTMHAVVVRLSPQGAIRGQATSWRSGDARSDRTSWATPVDGWVLADLCREAGAAAPTGGGDEGRACGGG